MSMGMVGTITLMLVVGGATLAQQVPVRPAPAQPMDDATVISMVQAGLDEAVIVAKIEQSAVAFDCSTQGLVSLKKAGVPTAIVEAMIARSADRPADSDGSSDNSPRQVPAKVIPIQDVSTVAIRADSEVLRLVIEQRLKELGGPVAVSDSADATLSFSLDCGAQRWSWYSGANYCTCEGSGLLESGGAHLWMNVEKARSANAAKAGRKLAERLVGKFVADWKQAKRHQR